MLRPLWIGLGINLFMSVIFGTIVSIQMGVAAGVIYFSLFFFTTYLVPIVGASYFFYFLQLYVLAGYGTRAIVLNCLLLVLWIELELLIWSILKTSYNPEGSFSAEAVLQQFFKKTSDVWTGVVFTTGAIVSVNWHLARKQGGAALNH